MFEISELKAKTLADLQTIAKSIGLKKTSQLNKLDLVYQILDTQAANPTKQEPSKTAKPKRKRVAAKKPTTDIQKTDISATTPAPAEVKEVEKTVERTPRVEPQEKKVEKTTEKTETPQRVERTERPKRVERPQKPMQKTTAAVSEEKTGKEDTTAVAHKKVEEKSANTNTQQNRPNPRSNQNNKQKNTIRLEIKIIVLKVETVIRILILNSTELLKAKVF